MKRIIRVAKIALSTFLTLSILTFVMMAKEFRAEGEALTVTAAQLTDRERVPTGSYVSLSTELNILDYAEVVTDLSSTRIQGYVFTLATVPRVVFYIPKRHELFTAVKAAVEQENTPLAQGEYRISGRIVYAGDRDIPLYATSLVPRDDNRPTPRVVKIGASRDSQMRVALLPLIAAGMFFLFSMASWIWTFKS